VKPRKPYTLGTRNIIEQCPENNTNHGNNATLRGGANVSRIKQACGWSMTIPLQLNALPLLTLVRLESMGSPFQGWCLIKLFWTKQPSGITSAGGGVKYGESDFARVANDQAASSNARHCYSDKQRSTTKTDFSSRLWQRAVCHTRSQAIPLVGRWGLHDSGIKK